MTSADLQKAFVVYTKEIESCLDAGVYWGLLHLVLTIPDICSSLDTDQPVGERYVQWCNDHFPAKSKLAGGDRYQMRCAVLHSGSTLPSSTAKKIAHQTKYQSFSFVDPSSGDVNVHQEISSDGTNITLNIAELAKETVQAIASWSDAVTADSNRAAVVKNNLHKLVGVQEKESEAHLLTQDGDRLVTEKGEPLVIVQRFPTTSST